LDKKIDEIEELKRKEKNSLNTVINFKSSLTKEENKYGEIKENLKSQKTEQEEDMKIIEDTLEKAKLDYEKSLDNFKSRARSIYMNSNKSYLDLLLDSRDLVEFTSKFYILNNMAKKDREIIQNLKTSKKDFEYKKDLLEMELRQLSMKIEKYDKTIDSIKDSKITLNSKINSLNEKIRKLEMEEDTLLEESKKLASKIKLFQMSPKKYIGGKMLWPVPSCFNITSQYGMRMHPVLGYRRMHTGIDIAGASGASIVAANGGTVRVASWEGGYGNTVIIDHGGGIASLYAHCSSILVKVGTKVDTGNTIAKIGSTGVSTGPHLHFEIRKSGEPIDPLNYLMK
jgi:murein DD-endopeptidase MepM/ murein hydrolase activator NlpD